MTDGIVVTFDITTEASFNSVRGWITSIFKVKPDTIPIILVGNKIDLAENRVVSKSDVAKITEEFGINYHETSAKNG